MSSDPCGAPSPDDQVLHGCLLSGLAALTAFPTTIVMLLPGMCWATQDGAGGAPDLPGAMEWSLMCAMGSVPIAPVLAMVGFVAFLRDAPLGRAAVSLWLGALAGGLLASLGGPLAVCLGASVGCLVGAAIGAWSSSGAKRVQFPPPN